MRADKAAGMTRFDEEHGKIKPSKSCRGQLTLCAPPLAPACEAVSVIVAGTHLFPSNET